MSDIANLLREAAEEIEMSRGYCDFADELRATAESLGEPVAWRAVGPSYTVVVTDPERATDSRWEPLYLAPQPAVPKCMAVCPEIDARVDSLVEGFWDRQYKSEPSDLTKGVQSYESRIAELEAKLAAAEADAERWLKVSEHEPPYGEHILIALQLAGGDWFICYGFVQSDWSLWSVDDECIGYDLDDDAYWKRVTPPIDAARGAK